MKFAVDNVTNSKKKVTKGNKFQAGESCSEIDNWVWYEGAVSNDFLMTVHKCYSDHLPLVLSPDAVWYTIVQGLCYHINTGENAEKYREKLVSHQGKLELRVRRDDFVKGKQNPWEKVFPEFVKQMETANGTMRKLFDPKYTTTTPLHQSCYNIALMDTMQKYYSYSFSTCCGIPEIELTGTSADWQQLVENTKMIGSLGIELDWWLNDLERFTGEFLSAANGKVNKTFWTNFYKLNGMSGGPYVSGEINVLFPYIKDTYNKTMRQNPYFTKKGDNHYLGVTTDSYPQSYNAAPVNWDYLGTKYDMLFRGGILGSTQHLDESSGHTKYALEPAFGWFVSEKDTPVYITG